MCRKYVSKLWKSLLLLSIFIIVFVNLIIDPYKEFDLFRFTLNQKQYFQSDLSAVRLSDLLQSDKYSIVFGTSRSKRLDSEMLGENIINFYPVYGKPRDIYNFLLLLNQTQVENIDKIYILLDYQVYKKVTFFNINSLNYGNRLIESLKNLNYSKIERVALSIFYNQTNYDYYFINNGSYFYKERIINKILFEKDIDRQTKEKIKKEQKFLIEEVKWLSKIEEYAKRHNKKTIYFTSSFYDLWSKKMDFETMRNLRKEFLKHIDGFYEFQYIPQITNDYTKFDNPTHLAMDGMKKVAEVLREENKSFYTNAKNFESRMIELKSSIESFNK